MSANFREFISAIDSARFGFGVAKVDDFGASVANTLQSLRELRVKLVISRVSSSDIFRLNTLEENGFLIKDTQLTYRNSMEKWNANPTETLRGFYVRKFKPSETKEIVQVAKAAFTGYGHYAADSRLDPTKCAEIYADWATNTCCDRKVADEVFVAEKNGAVIGYLSFKIATQDGVRFAAGGMGAVSEMHRGSGVFSALVKHGLQWGKEMDLAWQEHSVITANFPVNHAFIGCGFRPSRSFVTLHGWL